MVKRTRVIKAATYLGDLPKSGEIHWFECDGSRCLAGSHRRTLDNKTHQIGFSTSTIREARIIADMTDQAGDLDD